MPQHWSGAQKQQCDIGRRLENEQDLPIVSRLAVQRLQVIWHVSNLAALSFNYVAIFFQI